MSRSIWRPLYEALVKEIESGAFAPGARIPTTAALAEERGISPLTAQKALEELQRKGYVTRDGRRGTIVAPRVKPSTGLISLIVDQMDLLQSFPRPELLAGIYSGLPEDCHLVLCDSKASPEREAELLEAMAEKTDGILLWPGDRSQAGPAISRLSEKGVPLVLLDRVPRGAQAEAVVTDSGPATSQAIQFLASRGHQKIALLSFDKPDVSTVAERCGAFEAEMERRGLSHPDLVRRLPPSLEVTEKEYFAQAVRDALFALVRGPLPATAILCVQDLIGFAVLSAAAELGLKVPEDLEVVTFNDWPPVWLLKPWQAHRIAMQPEEMGRTAIERLKAQLSGGPREPVIHRTQARLIAADGLFCSVSTSNSY